ncbi:MAG: hypothetical protein ACETVN_02785 [Asgard group archaeon]
MNLLLLVPVIVGVGVLVFFYFFLMVKAPKGVLFFLVDKEGSLQEWGEGPLTKIKSFSSTFMTIPVNVEVGALIALPTKKGEAKISADGKFRVMNGELIFVALGSSVSEKTVKEKISQLLSETLQGIKTLKKDLGNATVSSLQESWRPWKYDKEFHETLPLKIQSLGVEVDEAKIALAEFEGSPIMAL